MSDWEDGELVFLALDMSLRWKVTYFPETYSIKPTFVTDRKVWPL
jgi:hypothetical protein